MGNQRVSVALPVGSSQQLSAQANGLLLPQPVKAPVQVGGEEEELLIASQHISERRDDSPVEVLLPSKLTRHKVCFPHSLK
jgi:hypothetical protein